MNERYIKELQTHLLSFFMKCPEAKVVERNKLTQYGDLLDEKSLFVKKQRQYYNRNDKTWKLSYILNQYIDESDDYIDSFLRSIDCQNLLFKTGLNPYKNILLEDRIYPLIINKDNKKYVLNKFSLFLHRIAELNDQGNIKLFLHRRLMSNYDTDNNMENYDEVEDTQYSIVEYLGKEKFNDLCLTYKDLYYFLESVFYEMFSIISFGNNEYTYSFDLLDGFAELINLMSYDQYNNEIEETYDQLQRDIIKILPFELKEKFVSDNELFISYFNDYIKEFIYRKKESYLLKEKKISLDNIEYNKKGEKYTENPYLAEASSKTYYASQKEMPSSINLDHIDRSMSLFQIEKSICQYLKELDSFAMKRQFIYELVKYCYNKSLTAQGSLNKHGSAYNYALYILRMIENISVENHYNEEDFVRDIKNKDFNHTVHMYLSLLDYDEYTYTRIKLYLLEMLNSTEVKKGNDSISRARNHDENLKNDMIRILVDARKFEEHLEKKHDYLNGDLYTDICNLCQPKDKLSKSAFNSYYIKNLLLSLVNEYHEIKKEEQIEKKMLVYAYYLKNNLLDEDKHIVNSLKIKSELGEVFNIPFYENVLSQNWEMEMTKQNIEDIEYVLAKYQLLYKTEISIIQEMEGIL